MKEKENNHPYIIAVGKSMGDISYYFIEIEKHLMCVSNFDVLTTMDRSTKDLFQIFQVPQHYDFIQTLDLFFKVHKVFGMNFEPNLVPAFNFIQYFIYELNTDRSMKPTNKMTDVYTRCKNASSNQNIG